MFLLQPPLCKTVAVSVNFLRENDVWHQGPSVYRDKYKIVWLLIFYVISLSFSDCASLCCIIHISLLSHLVYLSAMLSLFSCILSASKCCSSTNFFAWAFNSANFSCRCSTSQYFMTAVSDYYYCTWLCLYVVYLNPPHGQQCLPPRDGVS